MFKMVAFLKRKPGMSVEEFREYYETRHAPLCTGIMQEARRYTRRYLSFETNAIDPGAAARDELDFADVITEVWFDDRAGWEATKRSFEEPENRRRVAEDEDQFLDRGMIRHTIVEEYDSDLCHN